MLLLWLTGCLYTHDYLDWVYTQLEDDDGDGFREIDGDCDDANPDAHPGMDEVCDGLDNDCSGDVDGDALDIVPWYQDRDQDGYGNEVVVRLSCDPIPTYATAAGDCNDDDPDVHPEAEIRCGEALDRDCDGVDEDFDEDGDGFFWCEDCKDRNEDIYPDAQELCNGDDDDCDGQVDEEGAIPNSYFPDADRDSYGDPAGEVVSCEVIAGYVRDGGDCDDHDAAVHPDQDEVCGNGVDDNCNGPSESCGLSTTASAGFIGETTFAIGQFSQSSNLVNVGDMDADGDEELAFMSEGQVVVQAAPFTQVDQPITVGALVHVVSSSAGLGLKVVPLGDTDTDGTVEVAITDPLEGTGSVYLLSTQRGVRSPADLDLLTGPADQSYFGYGILRGNFLDPNGDHLLVTTANLTDNSSRTYAVSLPLAAEPTFEEVLSTGAGEGLLGAVSYVLDANGDGQDDIAVSRCDWDYASETQKGTFLAVFIGPLQGQRLQEADVEVEASCGIKVSGGVGVWVDDSSGDGLPELWMADGFAARLVPLAQSGHVLDLQVASIERPESDGPLHSLTAPDLDGDQVADLILGFPLGDASGSVGVYRGPFAGVVDAEAGMELEFGGTQGSWAGRYLTTGLLDDSGLPSLAIATPGSESWAPTLSRLDVYPQGL